MTHTCTICRQELPDSAFYPSQLKKHNYQCKKCTYEKYGKKSIQKYVTEVRDLPNKNFDALYGGYVVAILNYVRPKEYKYTIKGTNGYMVQTNDIGYFKKKMDEICQEQKPEK